MLKPNGYDETKKYGDFEPLAPGGYVCCIRGVVETQSSTGKDMIKIFLDIAEGPETGRFQQQYDNDSREDKKWPCIVYQLVLDNEGKTNRGFKTFIESVEESNNGFQIVWGDGFAQSLQGKLIGTLFRKEEYQKSDGRIGTSTKCYSFRDTQSIREGKHETPEDKLLTNTYAPASAPSAPTGQFMNIPDGVEDDLPFN